ncbi:DUF2591 family protein [Enterobacter asburiae]|uniref:phage protein NinX family protein n=1 Tax=Enterobacter asburiae TaxID=61645 RepID=UPI0018C22E86|nr:phage protein NinX family protein [Enterobacter asburiae]MBG0639735.1 DUF2591 family protein [Enterobacter asburiae]
MDYSQLSDRDIDALVLQEIYGNQAKDKDIMRAWLRGGFKYTTNPADAWPIITEAKISLLSVECGDGSELWLAKSNSCPSRGDANPLRAAMIVFLMMQDANNA